ncbi:MAG: ABC transporter substrate-binding protein [Ignavibacteriaceae bacterium]
MKTFFNITIIFIVCCVLSSCSNKKNSNPNPNPNIHRNVSIVFPVTIEAFRQLEKGYESVCKNTFNTRYFSAEGDPDKFETVIQSALLTNPDYLVTVGTQITNTAFGPKFKNDLPTVVASAISSPEKVNALVDVGIEPKRKLPVAIILDSPKEDIYKLFAETLHAFLPKINRVGILYNTSEINSKETATEIKKNLSELNIQTIDGVINNSDDVEKVTDYLLLKDVKAIIIPLDKNAVTKASSIVKKCFSKNIPVFSLDDGTVKEDGVSVGISVDYKIIGKLIGETILKISNGNIKAEDMPIIQPKKGQIYVNIKSLKKLNISIPTQLNNLIIKY